MTKPCAGTLKTYYAANGTPVKMTGNVLVHFSLEVTGFNGKKMQSFKLPCCVGHVTYLNMAMDEYVPINTIFKGMNIHKFQLC